MSQLCALRVLSSVMLCLQLYNTLDVLSNWSYNSYNCTKCNQYFSWKWKGAKISASVCVRVCEYHVRGACVLTAADVWYRGCNDSCAWLTSQVLGSKPNCYDTFCQADDCNTAAVTLPSTTSPPTTTPRLRSVTQTTTKSSASSLVPRAVVAGLQASLLATALFVCPLINWSVVRLTPTGSRRRRKSVSIPGKDYSHYVYRCIES